MLAAAAQADLPRTINEVVYRQEGVATLSGDTRSKAPLAIIGLLVVVTLVAIAITTRFGRVDDPGTVPAVPDSPSAAPTTSQRGSLTAVQSDLRQALNSDTWPASAGTSTAALTDCYEADPTTGDHCTFGATGKPLIVVYGDSFALNLLPTLDAAVGKDFSIKGLVNFDCTATALKLTSGGGENCAARAQRALTWTTQHHPALVIVAQNPRWLLSMSQGQGSSGSVQQWIASENALSTSWAPASTSLIFTSGSLPTNDASDCKLRGKTPAECVASTPSYYNDLANAERANTRLKYLDVAGWYCLVGQCPAFSGGTDILNSWWLTKEYATNAHVVADLRAQLSALGIRG